MTQHHSPVRKKNQKVDLLESYCPGCGVFIAASGSEAVLEIAEKRHRCPSLETFGRGLDTLRGRNPAIFPGNGGAPGPLAPASDGKVDALLSELARKEQELDRWLQSSEANALWFRKDPVAAIRAAGLGIPEEVLKELETVTAAILQKLRPASDL